MLCVSIIRLVNVILTAIDNYHDTPCKVYFGHLSNLFCWMMQCLKYITYHKKLHHSLSLYQYYIHYCHGLFLYHKYISIKRIWGEYSAWWSAALISMKMIYLWYGKQHQMPLEARFLLLKSQIENMLKISHYHLSHAFRFVRSVECYSVSIVTVVDEKLTLF